MVETAARSVSSAMAQAMACRDVEAIDALLHPAATIWHNTDGITQMRAEAIDNIAAFFSAVSHCRYDEIRLLETADGYVEQHIAEMAFGTGTPILRIPCCLVVTMRDGLIAQIEEYLDTAAFASSTSDG